MYTEKLKNIRSINEVSLYDRFLSKSIFHSGMKKENGGYKYYRRFSNVTGFYVEFFRKQFVLRGIG